MKSTKIRYQVVVDGKVVGTRTSARTYTHAVVVIVAGREDGGFRVYGYAGSLLLAEKSAAVARRARHLNALHYAEVRVVPVEVVTK